MTRNQGLNWHNTKSGFHDARVSREGRARRPSGPGGGPGRGRGRPRLSARQGRAATSAWSTGMGVLARELLDVSAGGTADWHLRNREGRRSRPPMPRKDQDSDPTTHVGTPGRPSRRPLMGGRPARDWPVGPPALGGRRGSSDGRPAVRRLGVRGGIFPGLAAGSGRSSSSGDGPTDIGEALGWRRRCRPGGDVDVP